MKNTLLYSLSKKSLAICMLFIFFFAFETYAQFSDRRVARRTARRTTRRNTEIYGAAPRPITILSEGCTTMVVS